jgi:chromosome segregation ATPase
MLEMLKLAGGTAQRAKEQAAQRVQGQMALRAQEQADALELLVSRAAQERSELHVVLDILLQRGSRIVPLGWQLEDATEKATALGNQLDVLTVRLGDLDSRASVLDTLDSRTQALTIAAERAEQVAQAAVGSDSEIQRHRIALEQAVADAERLQEISHNTEARLRAINVLAEQVTQRTKALEHQQQIVERAVVQSSRVAEMVWEMDAQLNTLNEGLKTVASAEERIARTEGLANEITAQFSAATSAREDAERGVASLKSDAQQLIVSVAEQVAALDMRRAEFDTFDARARSLQDSMTRVESRMATVTMQEKQIGMVARLAQTVTQRFDVLVGQADELSRKQAALEELRSELDRVDTLARHANGQMDALRKSQADLDALRQELHELTVTQATVSTLSENLKTEREALLAFDDRMSAMSSRASTLDTKMDVVLRQLPLIEAGAQKADQIGRHVASIDWQLDAVERRLPILENIEGRLDRLGEVSATVDTRLKEQLARRAELETLKTNCDEVADRAGEIQQRLEGVRLAQSRLLPLVESVDRLQRDIEAARVAFQSVARDEAYVVEQEKRFTDLLATSRTITSEVGDRVEEVRRLGEELNKAAGVKDALLTELAQAQVRQHDVIAKAQTAEGQLVRAEETLHRIEQRSAKAALSSSVLAGIEARFLDITRLSEEIERSAESIVERGAQVQAVKAEVDEVHAVCARSKADLDQVVERRAEVTSLKSSVDELLSRIGDTDARMAALDARGEVIDEVHAKAEAVATLLDDVRGAFDMLAERQTVVDQVADKVAGLESLVEDARAVVERAQRQPVISDQLTRKVKDLRVKGRPTSPVPLLHGSEVRNNARMTLVG